MIPMFPRALSSFDIAAYPITFSFSFTATSNDEFPSGFESIFIRYSLISLSKCILSLDRLYLHIGIKSGKFIFCYFFSNYFFCSVD